MSKKIDNDKAIQDMRLVLMGQGNGIWSSKHQRALKDLQSRRSRSLKNNS
jgi:hypothetical protein